MTRLPDTDFMYKAWPAGTKEQAPKLPAKSSLVQRASLEVSADGQPVSLYLSQQNAVILRYALWCCVSVHTCSDMSLHMHVLLGQCECTSMRVHSCSWTEEPKRFHGHPRSIKVETTHCIQRACKAHPPPANHQSLLASTCRFVCWSHAGSVWMLLSSCSS